MKPSQHFPHTINRRLLPYQGEAEEVPQEAVPHVAAAEDEEIGEEVKEEVAQMLPDGAHAIHPHHQSPAVNAITFMGTRLGTAWLPTPARGRTDAPRGHEVPASLRKEKRKKIIRNSNTTSCFQALIQ